MNYLIEICANSIRSAIAAEKGGAGRIELCDNMAEGGTTPSYGMIAACKELLFIPVYPIIRPRGGNFVYNDDEYLVMKKDIQMCRNLGCEGVVLGILTEEGDVDAVRCEELVRLARPMHVTFHRAFDRTRNMNDALESIITLGFDRILSSGGEVTAEKGAGKLKDLISRAGGRITIMPGSGITHFNIATLAANTDAREFHSTAKSASDHLKGNTGSTNLQDEDKRLNLTETTVENVRALVDELGKTQ